MARTCELRRETGETNVYARINLDGCGKNLQIMTGIGFFNHMLELLSRHSGIDIFLEATGDLDVDMHHTVEDVGIVLGTTVRKALGDKKGIERFADVLIPMDETLVQVAVDLSDRPFLIFEAPARFQGTIGKFDTDLIREFLVSFTHNLRANLHIRILYGENKHHIAEAIFKGLARALKKAIQITGTSIPSTKGVL
jgi:imidazoleglycerol-phosphate dehydratase